MTLDSPQDGALFLGFAEVAERVGATTKRLEKAAYLAAYFDCLGDDELMLAARYFAGYAFPLRDQRTTNAGGSALFAAILQITKVESDWLNQRLVARGDYGDAAFDAWMAGPETANRAPRLTLAEVGRSFDRLAATAGSKAKLGLVVALLQDATPLEARYLVKLVTGELRIGLQEGAVEDAIARWQGEPVERIQWVNMLTGDTGETALLARQGRLDEARMRLFHPLKFMLATAAADLADVERQMPETFVVEDKFDGIRAQAHIAPHVAGDEALHGTVVAGRRVALFSRTLDEITESFPDLLEPLAQLVPVEDASAGLILDGEIVPVRGEAIAPFQELQQRLGRKIPTAAILERVPVAFVIYDALYGDGYVLLERPLTERRARIDALPTSPAGTVRAAVSKRFSGVAASPHQALNRLAAYADSSPHTPVSGPIVFTNVSNVGCSRGCGIGM